MKTILASYLRHALTALASLGVFLAARGWIDAGDAAGVNTAGASIAGGLVVVATAILARLAITLLGKLKLSGVVPGLTDKTPAWVVWFGMVGLAGLAILALPGCATTVTKTTLPDGTVVEVTAKASDPAAMEAAAAVSGMLIPILIHAEK